MPHDVMQDAYESTAVGATTIVTKDSGQTYADFQAIASAASALSDARKIHIEEFHRESQTGNKFVDSIKFVRLC